MSCIKSYFRNVICIYNRTDFPENAFSALKFKNFGRLHKKLWLALEIVFQIITDQEATTANWKKTGLSLIIMSYLSQPVKFFFFRFKHWNKVFVLLEFNLSELGRITEWIKNIVVVLSSVIFFLLFFFPSAVVFTFLSISWIKRFDWKY